MKLKVAKVDVWAAAIKDKPGGLADKLAVLAAAGANLEFVIARREASKPGTGVVFATPLKGPKERAAAKKAGFRTTARLHSVRIEGTDKPGLGATMTEALAVAGINLRGLSAAAIGKKCIVHLAFDKATDAKKAMQVLRKM
ncbi:MAG: amino acid-binding protein [Phycisphaerae bacterium]|nr:amino acid-binding protein [Phycisphaerae bacterium]